MKKITLFLATALLAFAPLSASAARIFIGGPVFGYGYAPYWGSYWGPGYAYGYYGPYDTIGTVKIDGKALDAQVFIDGAYAGTVKDNKTMHLRQGNYNVEVKRGAQSLFSQKIYVTAGKTMHIAPGA